MMNLKKRSDERIRSSGEVGSYCSYKWIEEAESKLTSAKLLRDIAKKKRRELEKYLAENSNHGRHLHKYCHPFESANKSSFLLLGYAIELLLKSGVVSLLINSPKHILDNQVKRYGHKLHDIAEVLHVPLEKQENELLEDLASFIVLETRYPVTANSIEEYCNKSNLINSKLSRDGLFDDGVCIYEKIKAIIKDIDGTRINPKLLFKLNIDDDGFLTFQSGGSIPPVCIIKYSKYQIDENENNLDCIKAVIEDIKQTLPFCRVMLSLWDDTDFYQVVSKRKKECLEPVGID